MNIKTLIMLLLPAAIGSAAATDTRSAHDTFDAFVGDWTMDLIADKETFGDRGGPGDGLMTCAWGPLEAWVDCELDAHYENLGRYVLKIVLYNTGKDGTYGAFVTNSFGGGRVYTGQWQSANELVYLDAHTDSGRKWGHQRTTYRFHDNGEISYVIDVSKDGQNYLPHSRGTYRRKQMQPGD